MAAPPTLALLERRGFRVAPPEPLDPSTTLLVGAPDERRPAASAARGSGRIE